MLLLSWTICLNTLLFYSASASTLLEYRITLPFSLKEYEIGRLYGTDRFTLREAQNVGAVELISNHPFTEKTINGIHLAKGQYTQKLYTGSSALPYCFKYLLPRGDDDFSEYSWNSFPLCHTVFYSMYHGVFSMNTTTRHVDNDWGNLENVHNLGEEDLARRQVIHIDIATIQTDDMTYDPNTCQTSHGSLAPGWQETWTGPVMTAYKLVEIESNWYGFVYRIENAAREKMANLNARLNKQIFCTMDQWLGLDMEDIRKIEEETKEELTKLRYA